MTSSSHNSSSAESDLVDPNVVSLNDDYIPVPIERSDNDSYPQVPSPRTPSTASSDHHLLPDSQPRNQRPVSYHNNPNFVSSPLNPNASPHTSPSSPSSPFARSRTHSRQSMVFNRVASEDSHALASSPSSHQPARASMILYRLASEDEQRPAPQPKSPTFRQSMISTSGDSAFTLSYDSKYPSGTHTVRKFVPYPFDPNMHVNTPEDDDALHDPSDDTPYRASSIITLRGFLNIGVLVVVILALLCLFIFYPVWHYFIQAK